MHRFKTYLNTQYLTERLYDFSVPFVCKLIKSLIHLKNMIRLILQYLQTNSRKPSNFNINSHMTNCGNASPLDLALCIINRKERCYIHRLAALHMF